MDSYLARVASALAVMALAFSLSSCWYVKQAGRFLSERAGAVPAARLAASPGTPERVAAFLASVETIRLFAVDGVGLRPTKNYTRYVAVDRDYVADVVSACAADSFERHRWRYPFLGELPYKGFYVKADAQREAARLKASGLDVIVREVDAFSSLGYFTDPLYSFMVDYDEDVLAELVIHESAHATLFVKGADQFNEEFATFVGRKGAEDYLASRYGEDSEQLRRRRARAADGDAFVAFIRETARQLELAYGDPGASRETKLEGKAAIIARRAAEYGERSAELFSEGAYRSFDMGSINNAYIDLYRLYEEDLSLYEAWFRRAAKGSLPLFVSSLADLAARSGAGVKGAMADELALVAP